ncbi:MAG: Metallophosphoesterase [Parcubacteria group bacterium GW2011_GWC2_42_6]|nr:MAG: Metallophosphoesterase [Parcubacteria group bacterium GW2011_GWA2_42_11]KKS66212.1 MAG: Metallophosphoesterase [Parcubacteria group bacterium GW2011_GWC2_42_6]KKT76594.1 MAG: Metallophosphoesterase [Parcubacteria group bacterium GW2011_GWF2_44_7]
MVLFLILAVLILFGAHYLIWFSAVRFFVLSKLAKNILAVGLGFLMVSFVLSSLLAHYWQGNIFARFLYGVSGFWLGWLVNSLLASAAAWLVIWLARLFNIKVNRATLGAGLFGISLVIAVYGVWNAFHPIINNISVKISDLPATWQGKKIIMISDVHLGHIYRADFMDKMAEKINAQQPEMILIDGDLFDGIDGDSLDELVEPLNKLTAPQGVYFVTGNHETYLGLSRAEHVLNQTKIKILDDEIELINGLQLIGVSYPAGNAFNKDVARAIQEAGYNIDLPSILMYHQPTNIADAKKLGIDLQLAGHTHNGQIWPIKFFVQMIFKGYEYGLHVEENYSEYTSAGLGTWGPPLRTGNRPEIVVIELK